jgi:phosphoglycolate phosphatase
MAAAHDLVLFDLDGTLSDPLPGIGRSINHALSTLGYASLDLCELANYVGPPLDETFKCITGAASRSELDALVARYRERYADIGYSENVLYPGIADALRRLGEAGIPLAVCTSKRTDFAERILEMFGLRSCFAFVNGGDVGVQKWQQIEGLLSERRVSRLTVMVGDRALDMMAAHRNGLQAAGVLWGYGSRAELVSEQPRYLFDSPPELLMLAPPVAISGPDACAQK